MFANHNVSYGSPEQTHGDPFSSCPFSSSSFSSESSSCSWEFDMLMMTPTSTPRGGSPSLVKLEGSSQNTTPTSSPNTDDAQARSAFCPMTSMPPDMMSSYADPSNFLFPADVNMLSDQEIADYSNFNPYNSSNTGLNNNSIDNHLICDTYQAMQTMALEPPALTLDLFPPESGMGSSPVSEDFVIASQTTFIDASDMYSRIAPVNSLHFDISYDSPVSEFDPNFAVEETSSDSGRMTYCMPYSQHMQASLSYSHSHSPSTNASSTPSCTSLRQSIYRPPPSAAALQRMQSLRIENFRSQSRTRESNRTYKEEFDSDFSATESKLKRVKRESPKDLILGGIRIHRPARKECKFKGCDKKFQRQEHLKRHERLHQPGADMHPCIFCTKNFSRPDNLKCHVRLHTERDGSKKSRRTAFHPGAMDEWKRMDSKKRGRVG